MNFGSRFKTPYREDFYEDRHQQTVYSANTILSIVFDVFPEINSAVDFGCGCGTWLAILKEKGVEEIRGLDGPWVAAKHLEIPKEEFHAVDFEHGIKLDRKYDLAISLEVAEHLRPEVAESFVGSLTNASDVILFSAAIPCQGGKNHLNEQWPDYWAALFDERDYVVLDFIRPKIWKEKKIPTWYRQNILMFVKRDKVNTLTITGAGLNKGHLPIAIVHPQRYVWKIQELSSLKGSLKSFLQALRKMVAQKIKPF